MMAAVSRSPSRLSARLVTGTQKGPHALLVLLIGVKTEPAPHYGVPLARLSKERPRDQAPRGLFFLAVQHRNQHRSG